MNYLYAEQKLKKEVGLKQFASPYKAGQGYESNQEFVKVESKKPSS